MDRKARLVLALGVVSQLAFFGCGGAEQSKEKQLERALPTREMMQVDMPAMEAGRGLTAEVGTSGSGLVGGPADLYSLSYYAARDVNALGAYVVNVIEDVTKLPPTLADEDHAVWGPLSSEGEPNEFLLGVERTAEGVYDWAITGRHKSAQDWTGLAAGRFEPGVEPEGRGAFVIDFDAIHALNPAEGDRGQIAYAFVRDSQGIQVRVHAQRVVGGETLNAGYAFGLDNAGAGMILFAVPEDINKGDADAAQKTAREALLIRTRWNPDGQGRSDIVATEGDLGASVVEASQCWGERFVSTYEAMMVDGATVEESGDVNACVLPSPAPPTEADLRLE